MQRKINDKRVRVCERKRERERERERTKRHKIQVVLFKIGNNINL